MGDETPKFVNSMEVTTEPLIRETTRITLPGVSEKMDYQKEARQIAEHYAVFREGPCGDAILALLNKVRKDQTAEILKEAAKVAELCEHWYEGKGDAIAKNIAEEIRALGRK